MAESALLVGRDGERERLVDALDRCRSGTGGVVLLGGEAGVGKSRLLAQVLSSWQGRRASATCVLGARAYAPWARALATLPGVEPDSQDDRHEAIRPEAVLGSLHRAARGGPTVLVLEDLHLADAASTELLPVIAEDLLSAPLLVLCTYRSDELPRAHPLRTVRAELRRSGRLVDIALRPLTEQQTAHLLAAIVGGTPSSRLVRAVQQRTDGLPFFIEEIAAALADGEGLVEDSAEIDLAAAAVLPLPETVRDAVLSRTADLRAQHETAVEYAATLGVQIDLAALATLAGPPEVDALIEAGLLVEVDAEVGVFRHALVREALYRSIPWARRRDRHRRAAEVLASRGAPPGVVAEHWVAAHEPAKARPLLLAGAEQHCGVHAYRDAAALAGRALALWPEDDDPEGRLRTLERLASCAELSGELASAATTWAEVARRRQASGDLTHAGAAHRRAANAAQLVGDLSRTAAEREAAAHAFARAGAFGDAAAERLALAEQLKAAGRLTESLDQAVAATEAAATAGRRDVHAHGLAFQGAVRSALGQGQSGVALARSGLELALSGQLSEAAGRTYYELAEALEYAADYAAAVDAYESAFELCRTGGFDELAQTCFACMSPAVRLMGDWDRTLAICTHVLADKNATILARSVAEEESGLITALRGDQRRARGPLRRAAQFAQANGVFGLEVGATWGLAVVAELDEDDTMARYMVSALLERCRTTEECHYALPALRWTASFLGERGDAEGVLTCHRLVAMLATRNGSAKVLSALAHVGAELALVDADLGQSHAQFSRSLQLLAGITAPYEQAHTQLRCGRVAAATGDRDGAVTQVTSAYRIARRLAAKPLARRCATSLAEMGEHVDRRLGRLAARTMDPVGLTKREQEVLRHMADGMTNREIAAELFLSTRTVDMHVRNLFLKLDCSSRTTAVQRATQAGLLHAGG